MSAVRVPGHTLLWEGAPHNENGVRMSFGPYGGVSGNGRGKCSCGATSDVVDSGGKRKQWHRDHKAAIAAEEADR